MKNKVNTHLTNIFGCILVILISIAGTICSNWFYRFSLQETIRGTAICAVQLFVLVFSIEKSKINHSFLLKNEEHIFRFCMIFLIGIASGIASSFLPAYIFPLPYIGLILLLFSNLEISVSAYLLICTQMILLSGNGAEVFLFEFLCGLFLILFYARIDQQMNTVIPPVIVTLFSAVSYIALSLLKDYQFIAEHILNPAFGIFLTLFFSIITLHIYKMNYISKYDDKYKEINDPEYELLLQLKQQNKEEYKLAIHIAYLSDRIADKLSLNRQLAKCGAYYRHIGILSKSLNSDTLKIAKEDEFPPELIALLEELQNKKTPPSMSETVVVKFAAEVITAIMYVLKEKPEENIQYNQIIEIIFMKQLQSGMLENSTISLHDFYQIKKYCEEERLYYDFLR